MIEANWGKRKAISIAVFVLVGGAVVSCKRAPFPVKAPEFYFEMLHDKEFVWHGPTSNEDRIPKLHAARALAYIGDFAVPFLLEAFSDPNVDILSLYDALDEIGLPVDQYDTQIIDNRDSTNIADWWRLHRFETLQERERYRKEIGIIE